MIHNKQPHPFAPAARCPFCGSARLKTYTYEHASETPERRCEGECQCSDCGALGPCANGPDRDAAAVAALTAWNTRKG